MAVWSDLIKQAESVIAERHLDEIYTTRLGFEISEIEKQGCESRWVKWHSVDKKFATNPNQLLLPWLLGMVVNDPIANRTEPMLCTIKASKVSEFKNEHGFVPSDLIRDADMPDIDIDCLPEARDPLKEYAIEQYGKDCQDGYGSVCSVGTWQTFKFKSAIQGVAIALGIMDKYKIEEYTTILPDVVDELREGGVAACKGMILNQETGEKKECKTKHAFDRCPKCGSTDTDGPTLGQLLKEPDEEFQPLRDLYNSHKEVIDYAVQLVGRIQHIGMHAGALIITDRPLYGNIPLAKSGKNGYWISMWTEGRSTQLSKFGYIKWDWLGLKTLKYIFDCCKLVEENRGITFGEGMSGWDDMDPTQNRIGHFFDGNGEKKYFELNDKYALKLANDLRTDSIFQFDTDLAKSILANGVKSFDDLLFYNAAGHPGPMQSIPEAVKNRDDKTQSWKKRLESIHPFLAETLSTTYGIILWQEQLAALWQVLGGFSSPEAQDARKAVAKKWVFKLAGIGQQWMDGATPNIGKENAAQLWNSMVTFGRYAFNKSHGIAYCSMAMRCLLLKAHFAPEWWAAVMNSCHPKKLVRYMGIARSESWQTTPITYCGKFKGPTTKKVRSVKFDTLNINNLTVNFTVTGDTVNQGMIGIKGIGKKAAETYVGKGDYKTLDEFINPPGRPRRANKASLERFIKLGAFKKLPGHGNMLAVWEYYQYKYCAGKNITQLKKKIKTKLLAAQGWDEKAIAAERKRQAGEFSKLFPKRRVPPKISNWKPVPDDSIEKFLALYTTDFPMEEKLQFQQQFLGYYIDSPLDVFECPNAHTIEKSKELGKNGDEIILTGIVVEFVLSETRTGNGYGRLIITDGIQRAMIMIWKNELKLQDPSALMENVGVNLSVVYDSKRNSFNLNRGQKVVKLRPKK